eukprot:201040_1
MSDSESESERPRALFIDFGSPNHHDQPDQANSDIETGLPTRTAHEGINALWHNEVEHLVNGNKVYNDYKGINLSLHTFEDILVERSTHACNQITKLLSEYEQISDMKSLCVVHLQCITRLMCQQFGNGEEQPEATIVIKLIDDLRECFDYIQENKDLYCDLELPTISTINRKEFIKNKIRSKEWNLTHLKRILKTNNRSCSNMSKRVILETLLNDDTINVNIEIAPPTLNRTDSIDNGNDTDTEVVLDSICDQRPPKAPIHKSLTTILKQLNPEITRHDIEKMKRITRHDTYRAITAGQSIVSDIQDEVSNFDVDNANMDSVLEMLNTLQSTLQDIQFGYAAAPRRQRQKNTVEYIKDRTKRIKQNNNETNRILNRLYELSLQTKLPAVLGFGNLDTIGSSALSQPKLWMSPTLMEASTSDCQQIVEHWDNIMKSIAQNGDILRSQDDYKLKEKVKQLLSSDSMTQEILKQAEDIGLGFLMQRIYEYNQGDDDTEMLDILEDLDDDNQMEIETDTED